MAAFDPSNGTFQYPPNGNRLVFNFLDTVNATWEAGQENSTACYLSLWYWPNSDPWRISYNQTVPCNGSQLVGLNVATQGYLGQFNFNYTRSDGGNGLFTSEIFNTNNDPTSTPVIWSLRDPTAASSSASNGLPGTITTVLVYTMPTSTSLPSLGSSSLGSSSLGSSSLASSSQLVPSSSFSPVLFSSPPTSLPSPSTEESSSLNPRQVAGISIGAVLAIFLALALLGVLLLKRKRQRATTRDQSHAPPPESYPKCTGNTANPNKNELLGPQWRELDGQERRAQLRGDGERWELNGETAEDMR